MLIFLDMNKKHFFKVFLRKADFRWILILSKKSTFSLNFNIVEDIAKTSFSKLSQKNFKFSEMLIFLDINRKKHFFKVIFRKPHLRWILILSKIWAKTSFSNLSQKNFKFFPKCWYFWTWTKNYFFKVILRKPHFRWILILSKIWAKTIFSKLS